MKKILQKYNVIILGTIFFSIIFARYIFIISSLNIENFIIVKPIDFTALLLTILVISIIVLVLYYAPIYIVFTYMKVFPKLLTLPEHKDHKIYQVQKKYLVTNIYKQNNVIRC